MFWHNLIVYNTIFRGDTKIYVIYKWLIKSEIYSNENKAIFW